MIRKFAGFLLVFSSLAVSLPVAAVAEDKLDDKLVRYVQTAKKSGEKEAQVRQKAMLAGWPEPAVVQAITVVYGSPKQAAASPAPVSSAGNTAKQPLLAAPPSSSGSGPAGDNGRLAATPSPSASSVGKPARQTSGTNPSLPYAYRIGAGDVLQVSVWKEPEASAGNVIVRPDGMISTPLTKEIHVAGLTPAEAETLITEKLIKVIQEPEVTVIVTGMTSKKIYAVGAVKKEGPIPYTYSMTVMQAIAEAGGLTDYAKRGRIYVLRNENGKESRFPFAYDDILKGKHMELNIAMLPGDTLVVPH